MRQLHLLLHSRTGFARVREWQWHIIPYRAWFARGKRVNNMRRLVFSWRHAWWKLILLRFLVYSSVATAQLALTPSSLNFGNVQAGSSSRLSVAVSNSGKSNLTISQAMVTGAGFSFAGPALPITLSPQQSASLSVVFSPQSSGTSTGNLSVVSSSAIGNSGKQRSSSTMVSLSGAGPSSATAPTAGYLAPNPSGVSFGNVQVGNSQTQYVTLTNSGGSSISISQPTVTGAGFSLSGFTAPESLTPGQSLTLSVAFAPTSSGTSSGSLTFTSNASDPTISVALSGTGASPGQLIVSPGSMSFGTIPVGTSKSQTGALGASGSSVTISSGVSSSSEFTVGGLQLPLTIAAGQSVPFSVTFSPQASGTGSANISFSSNASISTITETVTGTGAATVQHSVDLSWNPSTSTIVGYNIYRGSISGGPYTKINSSLNATPNYTDSTVQSGQTYFYVTTAVNSTGVESAHSNEVSAVVPTP
jgi:Abnormal spindle-like microcephaly-assoc'd, ASPM-SPD-2-Hydin